MKHKLENIQFKEQWMFGTVLKFLGGGTITLIFSKYSASNDLLGSSLQFATMVLGITFVFFGSIALLGLIGIKKNKHWASQIYQVFEILRIR